MRVPVIFEIEGEAGFRDREEVTLAELTVLERRPRDLAARRAILDVATTPVEKVSIKGRVAGGGTAGLAVAHFGSNNMITFRYKLRTVPMKIAEKLSRRSSIAPAGIETPVSR